MSDNIRIKTTPGGANKNINIKINQKFDFIEILSLKISQAEAYRRFCSDYGVIVGRVIVNQGVGVPNAKVSVFIPIDDIDLEDPETSGLYPYEVITDIDSDGVPYNLLPRNSRGKYECFTPIGTFPSKREIQDNPEISDIYCNYYKFTTTTNESGDYMFFGVPVGTHLMHVDADISDIGILSQRPYDLVETGGSLKEFHSATKFKGRNEATTLNQLKTFSPLSMTVPPFWGDTDQCEVGIARADVNLAANIIPKAIFMGSLVTDNDKHALSRRCIPRKKLGKMDEMVTGEGRIEMIRKTTDDTIERWDVLGGDVIDEDGTWAYQIPMNRDYMVTAEDGTFVPSEDTSKGIPTTASVRFRIGMNTQGDEGKLRTRAKYLVPHNPTTWNDANAIGTVGSPGYVPFKKGVDFTFDGTTHNDNFTTLSWNQIYTVKNYISRTQARGGTNNRNFIGFKNVDDSKGSSPIPFNKMDTDVNPLFTILCLIIKLIARVVWLVNYILVVFINFMILALNLFLQAVCWLFWTVGKIICSLTFNNNDGCKSGYCIGTYSSSDKDCDCEDIIPYVPYMTLKCSLDGGNKEYAPGGHDGSKDSVRNKGWTATFEKEDPDNPGTTIDTPFNYPDDGEPGHDCKGTTQPYSIEGCDAGWSQCQAAKLADALDMFKFDFYNDWINGTIYPFLIKHKTKKRGKGKEKFCEVDGDKPTGVDNDNDGDPDNKRYNNFWLDNCTSAPPQNNRKAHPIYLWSNYGEGVNNYDRIALKGGYIKKFDGELYYSPISNYGDYKLYATDIVNLGSVFDDDWQGRPKLYQYLPNTTFNIPPLVAQYDSLPDGAGGEKNGIMRVTGFDTELAGAPKWVPGSLQNGLIANITCLGIWTDVQNCINIRRLSELGMGLDEWRALTGGPNNKIDDNDVEQDYVRGIFKYLNTPGSINIESVLLDGGIATDQQPAYKNFRIGTLKTSPRGGAIIVYENSFFFYFGLNQGMTALDKMKSKYFTECVVEPDIDFFIIATHIDADDIANINPLPIGGITIDISGGQGPFTFIWQGPSGFPLGAQATSQNLSGVIAGTYNVTAVDANGNKTNATFVIPGPPRVECNVQGTPVNKNGGNDGSITVNVSGGTPNYTILVDNYDLTGSTTGGGIVLTNNETATVAGATPGFSWGSSQPMTAGYYQITVSDSGIPSTECKTIIRITEPSQFTATITGSTVTCYGGSNGTAKVNVSGGVGMYVINWAHGPTTDLSLNLTPGLYTVTVTDNNGIIGSATSTLSYLVTSPGAITHDPIVLTDGCSVNNGQIEVKNIGGGTAAATTPHYTIKLTGGYNNITQTKTTNSGGNALFTGLGGGTKFAPYKITIIDGNGCEKVIDNLELYTPKATLSVSTAIDSGDATKVIATVSGGVFETDSTKPWGIQTYHLDWYINGALSSGTVISTTPTRAAKSFPAGNAYNITVKVTDKSGNGCTTAFSNITIVV